MSAAGLLIQLFVTFFVIGMFTFGGGYAIISLIQNEIVTARGWIDEATFTDIAAISQSTPGPIGLNCSTYVGYEVMKDAGACEALSVFGSFAASLAIVLPSFIIMLLIVKFYSRYREKQFFKEIMKSLKPVVVGLIAAAAFGLTLRFSLSGAEGPGVELLRENFPDWKSAGIAALCFVASYCFKQGPIRVLAAGAVLGLLLY